MDDNRAAASAADPTTTVKDHQPLPRLIVVPNEVWDALEDALRDGGITLLCTDGVRSYRPALAAPGTRAICQSCGSYLSEEGGCWECEFRRASGVTIPPK